MSPRASAARRRARAHACAAVVVAVASSVGAGACGEPVDPRSRAGQLGQVNSAIPARMVGYLEFEWRTLGTGQRAMQVDAIVPIGWRSQVPDDRYAAWLSPGPGARLSLQNVMALGVDCAGPCAVKSWPEVLQAQARREVPDDGVRGDEVKVLPDGGTRVTRWGVASSGKASAYVGWAGPADVQLRRCVVRLAPSPRVDADVVDAIEVFARACEAAVFTGTGASPPAPGATPRSGT